MATSYVGRFAPSPSGPLHFGSLVCALASFLHARQHSGKWLVRIEDIDTPRIDSAMTPVILNSLQVHGLEWDGEVLLQSERLDYYQGVLKQLSNKRLCYACACSRKQIRARSDYYDGHCRELNLPETKRAIRFKQLSPDCQFTDLCLGEQCIQHKLAFEDAVLRRADGIFAYHLVVVADDIAQKVSHIIRGNDLLLLTPVHQSLYNALNADKPIYGHIPLIAQAPGQKLSKQHHSPPINDLTPLSNLKMALCYLGIRQKMLANLTTIQGVLDWAIQNWQLSKVSKQTEMLISTSNGLYSMPSVNNKQLS